MSETVAKVKWAGLAASPAFLGVDPTQVAALQLLAGGLGLANQLVHDYLVQLRQRGLASANFNRYH